MSVLSLYMFRQIAQAFLILIGVLTALVWVSQAIRLLNLVIEKGRSLGEFLALTGYLLPWIAGLVAPTALFVATVYVLYRLNSDSELVVAHAAGSSKWRMLRPFALAAMLVTGFMIFVNIYAMPHGMRAFRDKLIEVRTDLIATLVQEGQFVSPEAGLTVHIRARDNNGDLLGLIFHDTRQPEADYTYLAERARLIADGNASSILMFNGTLQRRRAGPREVDVVKFERYQLDLGNFGPNREVPYYEASEKYMSELLNPDPDDPIFRSSPGKIFAEAHDRLSSPLYAFAMMLIGFAGLSSAQSNRIGRLWLILGVAGAAIGLRVGGATIVNLMVKQNALVPLAYVVPATAILASMAWLFYESRGRGNGAAFAEAEANRRRERPGRAAPAASRRARVVSADAPAPERAETRPRPRKAPAAPNRSAPSAPDRRDSDAAFAKTPTPRSPAPARGPITAGPDPREALRRFASSRPPEEAPASAAADIIGPDHDSSGERRRR